MCYQKHVCGDSFSKLTKFQSYFGRRKLFCKRDLVCIILQTRFGLQSYQKWTTNDVCKINAPEIVLQNRRWYFYHKMLFKFYWVICQKIYPFQNLITKAWQSNTATWPEPTTIHWPIGQPFSIHKYTFLFWNWFQETIITCYDRCFEPSWPLADF